MNRNGQPCEDESGFSAFLYLARDGQIRYRFSVFRTLSVRQIKRVFRRARIERGYSFSRIFVADVCCIVSRSRNTTVGIGSTVLAKRTTLFLCVCVRADCVRSGKRYRAGPGEERRSLARKINTGIGQKRFRARVVRILYHRFLAYTRGLRINSAHGPQTTTTVSIRFSRFSRTPVVVVLIRRQEIRSIGTK